MSLGSLTKVLNSWSREFFGTAAFQHPAAASNIELSNYFTFIDQSYEAITRPSRNGETLDELHTRYACAIEGMIRALDNDPKQPRAVLLCTHAAGMICIGRVLTGRMPSDPTEEDFKCGTCALSRFDRRRALEKSPTTRRPDTTLKARSNLKWHGGRDLLVEWDCTVNGDCSFLTGGEERPW